MKYRTAEAVWRDCLCRVIFYHPERSLLLGLLDRGEAYLIPTWANARAKAGTGENQSINVISLPGDGDTSIHGCAQTPVRVAALLCMHTCNCSAATAFSVQDWVSRALPGFLKLCNSNRQA